MISALASLAKQLAVAGARAAVDRVAELVRGKRDVKPEDEPPHPGFRDLEWQRQQERASIAHKVRKETDEQRR